MKDFRPAFAAMIHFMNAFMKWLERAFIALTLIALLAIVAVVLLQVVARYGLPQSPAWTEELSRYLFVYLVVLPSGIVISRNRHVRLELYHHRLSARQTALYQLLCHAIVGVFGAFCLPSAWEYALIGRMQTSPAMAVPMMYVFVSTVLFFALILLHSLCGMILAIRALVDDERTAWN